MRIEAYFSGIKRANEVVDALKNIGCKDAVVDLNDHYEGYYHISSNLPGNDKGPVSQSNLVLKEGEPLEDISVGPLMSASPMVSGMGGFEEIADVNFKVITNIDNNDEEKVKQLLNSMGGDLKDPNFKIPKGLENISQDEVIGKVSDNI